MEANKGDRIVLKCIISGSAGEGARKVQKMIAYEAKWSFLKK